MECVLSVGTMHGFSVLCMVVHLLSTYQWGRLTNEWREKTNHEIIVVCFCYTPAGPPTFWVPPHFFFPYPLTLVALSTLGWVASSTLDEVAASMLGWGCIVYARLGSNSCHCFASPSFNSSLLDRNCMVLLLFWLDTSLLSLGWIVDIRCSSLRNGMGCQI